MIQEDKSALANVGKVVVFGVFIMLALIAISTLVV